ncbi:MAG: Mur ligase family protein [Polyangiaceae bacterium]
MGLDRVLPELYARASWGMRLGLEPMRAACKQFDHPERGFEAAHIAGTNGKGSVAAMLESIVRETGKKTGLYTSPHLCRFAERIRIDGKMIDDDVLASILSDVLTRAKDLSFFEAATLTALVAFREAKVDVGVLEVGIGGRLDATNVIPPPRAAAVTRIALDHTDRLGTTIEAIAREKAGICKPGVDLVLGEMSEAARSAINEVAVLSGGTSSRASDHARARAVAERSSIALAGAHQVKNAGVACVLGERLGADEGAQARGISSVIWAGRLETLEGQHGPTLLDAAHNPDGAASLARHLAASGASPAKTALVFGALADKEWKQMIEILAPLAQSRFYVAPKGRAATPPETISAHFPGVICDSIESALARARATVGGGLVVVAGSIYLIGEARAYLLGLAKDPPVAL